jgi:hypothetical protein
MNHPGVARFEAGGTTPTLRLLEFLATALGLTVNVSQRRRVGQVRVSWVTGGLRGTGARRLC